MTTRSTTLIIIRHGETEWNREGRMQGHLDSSLTEQGVAEATRAARDLAPQKLDALYTSDLGRAVQTAEIFARALGLDPILDPRLRERNLGSMQGETSSSFSARCPEEARAYRTGDPAYEPPGGESQRRLFQRSVRCCEEIAARHTGGCALVITHGGVLSCLFRHALAIGLEEPRRFSLSNGAVNRFTVSDGRWRLESWGLLQDPGQSAPPQDFR